MQHSKSNSDHDPHSAHASFFRNAAQHPLLTRQQEHTLFNRLNQQLRHWVVKIAPFMAFGEQPFDSVTPTEHSQLVGLATRITDAPQTDWSDSDCLLIDRVRKNYPCVQLLQQRTDELHNLDIDQNPVQQLRRIKTQTAATIDRLTSHNLRLVIKVARQHNFLKLPLMDLIQEGSVGLLKAIERYQLDQNTRFSTYAWWWIKQSITLYVRKQGGIVRKPENVVERMLKLLRQFPSQSDYSNTKVTRNIARDSDFTEKEIEQLLQLASPDVSLEAPLSDNDDSFYNVFDDERYRPDDFTITDKSLQKHLSKLSSIYRTIITLRYGLDTGESLSFREIGNVIGKSTERTRQLELEALKALKAIIRP